MPTTPTHPVQPAFGRRQAWALHTALMEFLSEAVREGDDCPLAVEALDRLEGDEPFEPDHLRVASDALASYLVDAPERDRAHAESALALVEAELV